MIGSERRGERLEERRYATNLATILRLDSAPTFVARPTPRSEIAVSNMHLATPTNDPVAQACDDAIVLSVSLLDGYLRDYWLDGRSIQLSPQPAGYVTVLDRRQSVMTLYKTALHNMRFEFSIDGLREVAAEENQASFDELRVDSGAPVPDEPMHGLCRSLLPAFKLPEQVNRLFVDQIGAAAATRMLAVYARLDLKPARGGLAPWQQRRAEEMLTANLAGDIPLADVATECKLSTSHFTRAFRQATGLPPHRWLLKHRVEKAKAMLRDSRSPLNDVAHLCGFADQSHFTRVFTRWVGQSPGAWRRCMQQ